MNHLNRMVAAGILAIVTTTATSGCRGLRFEFEPLVHAKQKTSPDILPAVNADGYLQPGPVFQSDQATLPPVPTATEKVIELREEISELKLSNARFENFVKTLQDDVYEKDHALQNAHKELQAAHKELQVAHTDLANTQAELVAWREDVRTLHEQLQQHEHQQREAFDGVVTLLEDVIEGYEAAESSEAAVPVDQGAFHERAELRYMWSRNMLLHAPRIAYQPPLRYLP